VSGMGRATPSRNGPGVPSRAGAFAPARILRRGSPDRGLSLVELLVVLGVLAAAAFLASAGLGGVDGEARAALVRAELAQIADAVRRFAADTGYYPRQGPFAPLADVNPGPRTCADDGADSAGAVDPASAPSTDWLLSPANLRQLLAPPVLCPQHPLASLTAWDPDTARGWRGPYLTGPRERVDVGDGLLADGSGDPVLVAGARLELMPAIADPFQHAPVVPGSYTACEENADNTRPCLLDWRAGPGEPALARHGRPLLLFVDAGAPGVVRGCDAPPCLLSFGADGRYEQGDGDDVVLEVR